MDKSVVICLNPFISHFFPTIAIANKLIQSNYKVFFIGFADMEQIVKPYGFDYLSLTSCCNQDLSILAEQHNYSELAHCYSTLHNEIQKHMESVHADYALMGISRYHLYLVPALRAQARVVFYSLCAGIPGFSFRTPPVTSSYIPSSSLASPFRCMIEWLLRFMRKGIISPYRFVSEFNAYPWLEIRKRCATAGVKWKFGIDGYYPGFPIIVLGSKHFEFGLQRNANFAGLCNHNSGSGNREHVDYFYLSKKPLIYCCFGTMSARYRNVNTFETALIEVFKENPQWNLLISRGKVTNNPHSTMLAKNIVVADYVDQQKVLAKASLMITHGGHGTVKECIYLGVPMIVVSCSYDQHGNAARVQKHGIGLRSSLLKKSVLQKLFGRGRRVISPSRIKPLIEKVLGDEQYKHNIISMRDRINADAELENTIINVFR